MKFIRLVLVLLGLLYVMPLPAADLVVARVSEWPPYFWQENGEWKGMDIEFYRALEKESGLAFHFDKLPWSRGIEHLKSGQCTIMTQLSRTPEREEYLHFIGPYAMEEMVLVVKKERVRLAIRSLTGLAEESRRSGLLVGIEENAFYSDAFSARFKSDATFRAQFDFAKLTMATMVANDRLFGYFDQRPVISHKIRTMPEYGNLAIHPFVIGRGPVYFGVSKRTPAPIIEKLQRSFDALAKRKAFSRIESAWILP